MRQTAEGPVRCDGVISSDGQHWTEVARGTFPRNAELKTVKFAQPATAKFLKLAAWSGHANGPWASLAELGVE